MENFVVLGKMLKKNKENLVVDYGVTYYLTQREGGREGYKITVVKNFITKNITRSLVKVESFHYIFISELF